MIRGDERLENALAFLLGVSLVFLIVGIIIVVLKK